jgi:cytochrome P450
LVKEDVAIEASQFRAGDMVLCALPVAGLDERRISDPERFDLDRGDKAHLAFSTGPHFCMGHYLARAQMRIFVEEWLLQIPSFAVAAEFAAQYRPGTVMQMPHLPLQWPIGQGATNSPTLSQK